MPLTFPEPKYLTFAGWKRGVITLVEKSHLPKDALETADNIFLVEDGQPTVRPGCAMYGTTTAQSFGGFTPYAINTFDYFDYNGAVHVVAVVDGLNGVTSETRIVRSTDNGVTWALCSGATLTFGSSWLTNQNGSYLYLTGQQNIVRYDGTTTLQVYTALTTPAAPAVAETGLAGTGYTYYYKTSAVNTVGFSAASAASTVVQTSVPRTSWDATTNFAVVTPDAYQATQTRADIYVSENNVDYFYLSSTTVTGGTFKDDGTSIPVPSTTAPTGNTTLGPKVGELANVGSRMYGVRDVDNRYRIWFTGAGTYGGSFSTAYDGGYLDWQPGGKFIPVKVEDYRDGKGTPLATVWCKSADGQGCILQMSLETLTIGDVSITVPSAYKLPGSRGTPSPGSVVNVLNDYYFYNSQAVYNLGSRAQFLNLLSTDEASANIRPSVRQINKAAESNIASGYLDAKVYFSVPTGGSTYNNTTMVLDTERKAWMPNAFNGVGFKKFLRYTDTSGAEHLLALRVTAAGADPFITEVSSTIQGDYGVAFSTSLTTGLQPPTRNRFEFQWTEEGEVEFSQPRGQITIELLGIDRSRGFRTISTKTLSSPTISIETGWDSFDWDTTLWDDVGAITVFSESSTKRYFNVQRELNGIQWRITTNSLDAGYVLRTLQTWGTETQAGKPRTWRLS